MNEHFLNISFLHTDNKLHNASNQVIQMHCEVCSHDDAIAIHKTIAHEVETDEAIFSTAYAGISSVDIARSSAKINRQAYNDLMFRLISAAAHKNLYLLHWDALDSIVQHLDNAADVIKLIDLKKLSQLVFKVDEIGNYSLDCAYYLASSDIDDMKRVRDSKWSKNFCATICYQQKFLLKYTMNALSANSLEEVHELLTKPRMLEVMPFGKNKGRTFDDLFKHDNDYLRWLRTNNDIMSRDKDLKFTLDKLFEIA